MNPGRLRFRISIQKCNKTPDGSGGYEEAWVDNKTVWANIIPLRAKEIYKAQQLKQEITHRVIMRYNADIKTSDRIKYKDKILDIKTIIDIDNRNEYLEILCIETGGTNG